MTWVKMDENYPDHPKVAPLSNEAWRIWNTAIANSNRLKLDGVIDSATLLAIFSHIKGSKPSKKRAVSELVLSGLWEVFGDKFIVHDIHDYQPTKAEILEISSKRAEAGRAGGLAKAKQLARPVLKPDPIRPVPIRSEIEIDRKHSVLSDNGKMSFQEVSDLGFSKYGMLGGINHTKIARLTPIYKHEFDAALATPGTKWGYFATVIENMRNEEKKPWPKKGKPKTGDEGVDEDYFKNKRRQEKEHDKKLDEFLSSVKTMEE